MIDSPFCFRQYGVSYIEPNDVEGGLRHIEESVYVKDIDKKIAREATTIQSEDIEGSYLQHVNVFKHNL